MARVQGLGAWPAGTSVLSPVSTARTPSSASAVATSGLRRDTRAAGGTRDGPDQGRWRITDDGRYRAVPAADRLDRDRPTWAIALLRRRAKGGRDMTESRAPYPVRVDAAVDPSVSRGLWLVTCSAGRFRNYLAVRGFPGLVSLSLAAASTASSGSSTRGRCGARRVLRAGAVAGARTGERARVHPLPRGPGAPPGGAAGAIGPARRTHRRGARVVASGRRRMIPPADVLVVGAGPTGLAPALQAHDRGVLVRIVGRRPRPSGTAPRGEAARAQCAATGRR